MVVHPAAGNYEGVFLAFQLPVEIPGISMATFMKYAMNAGRRAKGFVTGGTLFEELGCYYVGPVISHSLPSRVSGFPNLQSFPTN